MEKEKEKDKEQKAAAALPAAEPLRESQPDAGPVTVSQENPILLPTESAAGNRRPSAEPILMLLKKSP